MTRRAAWLALAFHTPLAPGEAERIAREGGPDPANFPEELLAREAEDLAALEALGIKLLTPDDPEFPARILEGGAAPALQIAGRVSLLDAEGLETFTSIRKQQGARLIDLLDSGGRALLVLSKGMLKARSLLRALAQPIADGSLAVVSGEPPRASWGPIRDARRDRLRALLARRTEPGSIVRGKNRLDRRPSTGS